MAARTDQTKNAPLLLLQKRSVLVSIQFKRFLLTPYTSLRGKRRA
jgi:hypothetical protein